MDPLPCEEIKAKRTGQERKAHREENKFAFWGLLEKADRILQNHTTKQLKLHQW
jgi:hypothetical protein